MVTRTGIPKYFRHKLCLMQAFVLLVLEIFCISDLRSQSSGFGRSVSPDEASAILSEYIRYPSVTGNEKPAGQYLEGICREKGLYVRVFTDKTDSYNFAASLYPLEMNKPNVIFLSHIDVVPGGDGSGWVHPPFSGAIIGDTVWGRGAADMKGAAVMQLMALASFTGEAGKSDLPANVSLLCVSGEEKYGKTGAGIISSTFLGELNPVVVFGEGGIGARNILRGDPEKPVFAISISDKRALWLKLRLINKTSGHGSVPPSEYANKIMINALHSLINSGTRIRFGRSARNMFRTYGKMETGITRLVLGKPGLFKPFIAGRVKKDPLLLSPLANTITITRFRGQENEVNQIPQEVEVMLDCRLLPETTTEEFVSFLKRKLKNDAIEISIIRETQNAPPTVPDKYYGMFCESLTEAYPGSGILSVLFPATTDNNYFRNAGVPVYGIIPAIFSKDQMKSIHNFNERISVEALIKGSEVYIRFLEKLFQ